MSAVTKTAPTFTQIEAPVVIATAGQGTLRTLDLTTKFGAWIYVMIGRRVATALTRFGFVSIRPTLNNSGSYQIPSTLLDAISSTVAAISTTLSASPSAGDATVSVTSATSLAVGDTVCLHSDDTSANRVEFVRIASISGTTITLERILKIAHTSGDRFTTMADVQKIWLPGGEHYEFRCQNNSGQSLVFQVESVTDNGDTIT